MGILQDLIDMSYATIPVFLIFLAAQLYLCFKGNCGIVKMIPVFVVILAVMAAFYVGSEDVSNGPIDIVILGILILWIIIPGLIGIIAAWISYIVYKITYPK